MNYDEKEPPVEAGDRYDAEIINFGKTNDPMIKIENYVVFIKIDGEHDLKIGDTVAIEITKALPRCGFARLDE